MYEFMILSQLMMSPMHGYGIRQVMGRALGPYRTVAWGPLYSMLRKLEAHGLIAPYSGDKPHFWEGDDCIHAGPPSKSYEITQAGRTRFLELMQVPAMPEPEYEFTFAQMIGRLGLVRRDHQRALLENYALYCRAHLAHLAYWHDHFASRTRLQDTHKQWILRSMERRHALWKADAAWVAEQIALFDQQPEPAEPAALPTYEDGRDERSSTIAPRSERRES